MFNKKSVFVPAAFTQFCSAVRRKGALALCLALCTLGLGLTASAHEPCITTFDAPGAGTIANGNGTFPAGINLLGTVAGYYNDASNVSHGFLWYPSSAPAGGCNPDGGKFKTFDAPGSDTNPADALGTLVTGINDLGATSGWYFDTSYVIHGFLRSPNGQFTTFDAPGASGTIPVSLNQWGAITGDYYTDSNSVCHGFLRTP